MECAVIATYRCNAKCTMCDIWQYPTKVSEEITPDFIREKLPTGFTRMCIAGGEPTLRSDLSDLTAAMYEKTKVLEISTNGSRPEVMAALAKDYPQLILRVSIEGLSEVNDRVRGLKHGFDDAMRTYLLLREIGIKNLGFGFTISGENCRELRDVYRMCVAFDCELANAVAHNSFYFHKDDNELPDRDEVEAVIKEFICDLLRSKRRNPRMRVRDWLRAYVNLGLLHFVQGRSRTLPCPAGTGTVFIDPWGRMLACNGSPEPWVMGDLKTQSWEEIMQSEQAAAVCRKVQECEHHCWMMGQVVPAMRADPKGPVLWTARSKMRLALGMQPDFEPRGFPGVQ